MKKLSIIILACSTAVAVQAQVGFFDSLNGTSLANYTWIPLLYAGTGSSGTEVSFADNSGNGLEVDVANKAGTAVQGLYLNNTGAYLPIGDMLVASVDWQTAKSSMFGIAVGSSLSLTPASGDGSDTRSQTQYVFAAMAVNSTTVASRGVDGSAGQLLSLKNTTATPIVSLEIARTTASTFDIYYDAGSGPTLLGTQTITTSDNVGDVIGFYGDLRADGSPAQGYLANLRVVAVPEPASLAMSGLGGLLVLIGLIRRKIA